MVSTKNAFFGIAVFVLTITVFGTYLIASAEPAGPPPNNNAQPPLNITNVGQVKDGGLSVAFNRPLSNIGFTVRYGTTGLGTITPNTTYTLDVAGKANATQLCIGGVCNSSWPSTSQWVTSGDNIYYNTGNVGIGTANPASGTKLDIVGGGGNWGTPSLRINKGAASDNVALEISSANQNWELASIEGAGSSNGLWFYDKANNRLALRLLSQSGDVDIENKLCLGGVCKNAWPAGGTVTQINTGTGLTGGPITTSGTISIADGGVGTAQLANGAVTSPKIAADAVTLGTKTTGNYVAGITQGTGISVSGTAGEGWSPTVTLNINGGATNACTGTQKVSGLSATGIVTCTNDVDTGLQGGGTLNYLSKFTGSGTLGNSLIFDNGSAIGIATADPTEGGNVSSRLTIRQADGSTALAIFTTNGERRFALNPIAGGAWTLYDGANSTWNAGISQKAGNVGINQTSPGKKLEVNGDIAITGTNALYMNGIQIMNLASNGNLNLGYSGGGTFLRGSGLNVFGDIKLGVSGNLFATGGDENLRIVRGTVDGSGITTRGTGFTVTGGSVGIRVVTFTTPFSSVPSITVSAIKIANNTQVCVAQILELVPSTSSLFRIETHCDGILIDIPWSFIAVGPR